MGGGLVCRLRVGDRGGENADDLGEGQFVDDGGAKPMAHSEVATSRLASRTTREIEKANIFLSTQATYDLPRCFAQIESALEICW